MSEEGCPYVSRGGLKLAAALDAFGLAPAGWVCADFGCNVGGFTDCLLQRGAERVYAIDTGYGALDYRLRRDGRVVVMERTNALHAPLPEPVDLVVIDVAWTQQRYIVPAAAARLRPGGRIVTLVKPHYEVARERLHGGVLDPAAANDVLDATLADLAGRGVVVRGQTDSPILGQAGNREFLVLIEPEATGLA
ncbi:MAG: TlyA family RNA methyltransferase [Phycisphaerae bacterium]|nr:TlyA family RNA methyltransferase [Phycisphaerae bacterium]